MDFPVKNSGSQKIKGNYHLKFSLPEKATKICAICIIGNDQNKVKRPQNKVLPERAPPTY